MSESGGERVRAGFVRITGKSNDRETWIAIAHITGMSRISGESFTRISTLDCTDANTFWSAEETPAEILSLIEDARREASRE